MKTMLKKLWGSDDKVRDDAEDLYEVSEAQYHRIAAKRYGYAAAAKFALAGMFAGLTGKLKEAVSHTLIMGGGVVLLATDIIPTIKEKMSEQERESKLLKGMHYARKVVAVVEGVAVGAIYAEQYSEISDHKSTEDTIKVYLIPSFATILIAKGTLGFVHNLVEAYSRGNKLSTAVNITVGPVTTLSQAALIIGMLKQTVSAVITNGSNAALSLGQSVAYAGLGLWHHKKSTETDALLSINFEGVQEDMAKREALSNFVL